MLQIYNSLTRQKEPFHPLRPNTVQMYVCGMTVYDLCHTGHARVLVASDVIARHFRHSGYSVNYVRNITDIDDKIIRRAEEKGQTWQTLTGQMITEMHADASRLGVLPPDLEPKATDHISHMVEMISELEKKGYAYAPGNGDVYYRVNRFSDYGKLSGKVLEDLVAGSRVDIDQAKENPLDFVLWKASKAGEPFWPSPWGEGRPGWHIECSAMGKECLGTTFDIHGGGPDLKFPHHENEIAQSEAANGATFVNTWMHAGAVRINKEKMSKSLGNFFTIREVLADYPGEVVRYFLVSSHYRSPIDYSESSLNEAGVRLERLYTAINGLDLDGVAVDEKSEWVERFAACMNDDFNTPGALAVLFDLAREVNRAKAAVCATSGATPQALGALLKRLANRLGLLELAPAQFLTSGGTVDRAFIEKKIGERQEAKKDRNFALADAIRAELAQYNVTLEDSREGTQWRIERRAADRQ